MVSSDNRMKARFALLVKGGEVTQAQAYDVASWAVGRYLTPGFGLSTCTHGELIAIMDAVAGEDRPSTTDHRPSSIVHRRSARPLRPDGSARASLEQYRLVETLREQLRMSPEEFAGIAQKATGKPHSTASKDLQKVIEALKAVRARRQKAAVRRQGAEPGEVTSGL